MPARTYLTAPPGVEPTEADGRGAEEPRERYVPGLAAPREPHVPSRWRTPLIVVAVILAALVTITLVLRVSAAQQAQDPSLFVPEPLEDPTGDGAEDDDTGEGLLPGDG